MQRIASVCFVTLVVLASAAGSAYAQTMPNSAAVPGTPMVLMGARYYDPISARFLSRDPLGDPINDYTYCGNNPVTRCDPDGTDWLNNAANVSAGWGDMLTFGLTGRVRMWLGANGPDAVQQHTAGYMVGTGLGIANDAFIGKGLVDAAGKGACKAMRMAAGRAAPRSLEIARIVIRGERGAVGVKVGEAVGGHVITEADRVLKLANDLNKSKTVLTEASAKRLLQAARRAGVRQIEDITMGHPERAGSTFQYVKHISIGKIHLIVK